MSTWRRDARLSHLTQTVRGITSPNTANANRMDAAVALIVRLGISMDVLLIKRSTNERDPWSGHMALPGGRWEPDDSELQQTAIRETFEETGVDLTQDSLGLGKLEDVHPNNPALPISRIVPFAFAVPPLTEALVASPEVESVQWVPIDLLTNPENRSSTRIRSLGLSKNFPSYHVNGEHVWGLTHRILSRFLHAYITQPRE